MSCPGSPERRRHPLSGVRGPGPSAWALLCVVFGAAGCGGSSGGSELPIVPVRFEVDATSDVGTLAPLWRDHYDLSYAHFSYADEPGFTQLVDSLEPRSWRCSVGRWEVGFPPPTGGDSVDPAVLRVVEREFYRGANDLAAADEPANYDFTYLDEQLQQLIDRGAQPFLCFDYMPFTLSSEQNPANAWNFNLTEPGTPYATYSYSNGIRTAPPADPAVYARVVRNTLRHVRGLFAGTTDFGVQYVEVGNEPDLFDGSGLPLRVFFTGTRQEFLTMYAFVVSEVDADAELAALLPAVRVGAGSFALLLNEPEPRFATDFLAGVAGTSTRLDFVSFHTYGDDLLEHVTQLVIVNAALDLLGLNPERINAEWGRALGGQDPVYDTIEHGLLRASVIAAMQASGVSIAHEALFRDPGTSGGELGLVQTEPPAHKPVSRCYQLMGRLDATPNALAVDPSPGVAAMAGRDAAGDRLSVLVAVGEPDPGTQSGVRVRIAGLPFGTSSFEVRQYRVTETSALTPEGIDFYRVLIGSGAVVELGVDVQPGEAGLYLFELERR